MSHQRQATCSGSDCTKAPPQLKVYQTFIFATPILFTLVLLLLFCLLYVRRRRTARAVSQIRAQFFARGLFAAPLDHGLNKSFRDGLPTILFDEKFAETRGDNQCAVCLGDYQLNEKLQQLPTCGHVFHLDCIDAWLATNSTCPICRTSLLQTGKIVPIASPAHTPQTTQQQPGQSSSAATSLGSFSRDRNFQPESAATSGEPSHRSASSMEEVVKESVEHVIQIER